MDFVSGSILHKLFIIFYILIIVYGFYSDIKEKNKIEKIEDCQMKQNKMHNKPETKTCQERR